MTINLRIILCKWSTWTDVMSDESHEMRYELKHCKQWQTNGYTWAWINMWWITREHFHFTLRVVSVTWAVGMKMDKIVNKVVMLIQGQVYTIDDTTRIYTCRTDSTSTQQEIHNNRATRRYTTGETTEKLLSEKFRSEVRAYRKKGIKFWLVSLIFGLNIILLLLEFNLYNYMKKVYVKNKDWNQKYLVGTTLTDSAIARRYRVTKMYRIRWSFIYINRGRFVEAKNRI